MLNQGSDDGSIDQIESLSISVESRICHPFVVCYVRKAPTCHFTLSGKYNLRKTSYGLKLHHTKPIDCVEVQTEKNFLLIILEAVYVIHQVFGGDHLNFL